MPRPGRLWIAVDVNLLGEDNPHDLDDPAILTYLRLLAWCKEKRRDGIIPARVAHRIGDLQPLVDADLLDENSGRHIRVVDWAKWNESTAHQDERRRRDRERKRHPALPRAEQSRESGVTPRGLRAESTRNRAPAQVNATPAPVPLGAECPHGDPYGGRRCIQCQISTGSSTGSSTDT